MEEVALSEAAVEEGGSRRGGESIKADRLPTKKRTSHELYSCVWGRAEVGAFFYLNIRRDLELHIML